VRGQSVKSESSRRFRTQERVGSALIPLYSINRISGAYSELKSFRLKSLGNFAPHLTSKLNRITSLRNKRGGGGDVVIHVFPIPPHRAAESS
jgi:hypothetical protein